MMLLVQILLNTLSCQYDFCYIFLVNYFYSEYFHLLLIDSSYLSVVKKGALFFFFFIFK